MLINKTNITVKRVEQLTQKLFPITSEINNHPLYNEMHTINNLRFFMEQHCFAVWDFMCLLKELHRRIVCTSAPWFPPMDPLSANLISSILVGEEGDINQEGSYASHFDIYITAMKKIGADISSIEKLLTLLRQGINIEEALEQLPIRLGTKRFVLTTFSFFKRELHELAAAFVYGREGITSPTLIPLVNQIKTKMDNNNQLDTLLYYCKRHIELDTEQHFPKAIQMLSNLIGNDENKLRETETAAIQALIARLDFLTDIQKALSMQ